MSRRTPDIQLTDFQRQVAIGTLLGDSSLSRPPNGKNYHLSCYHSEKQREWLVRKHGWLSPASRPIQWCSYLDKRSGKVWRGGRFHTVSIPCFTNLAKLLYRDRRKYHSAELLISIDHPVCLACLICDDGSWDGAGIAIASKQFTIEENHRLAAALRRAFGLSISAQTHQKYPYVRITAKSVEEARRSCEPYVPESLRYKFGPTGYSTSLCGTIERKCSKCGKLFSCYESSGQVFCCRRCADAGQHRGYSTRTRTGTCLHCGRTFVQWKRGQLLCPDCGRKRGSSRLRATPIACVVCGKPVVVARVVTCSKSCGVVLGHRKRLKPELSSCVICGRLVRRPGRKTCSRSCGAKAAHETKGHVPGKCAICGRPVKRAGRKTCSRSCGVRFGHQTRANAVERDRDDGVD